MRVLSCLPRCAKNSPIGRSSSMASTRNASIALAAPMRCSPGASRAPRSNSPRISSACTSDAAAPRSAAMHSPAASQGEGLSNSLSNSRAARVGRSLSAATISLGSSTCGWAPGGGDTSTDLCCAERNPFAEISTAPCTMTWSAPSCCAGRANQYCRGMNSSDFLGPDRSLDPSCAHRTGRLGSAVQRLRRNHLGHQTHARVERRDREPFRVLGRRGQEPVRLRTLQPELPAPLASVPVNSLVVQYSLQTPASTSWLCTKRSRSRDVLETQRRPVPGSITCTIEPNVFHTTSKCVSMSGSTDTTIAGSAPWLAAAHDPPEA